MFFTCTTPIPKRFCVSSDICRSDFTSKKAPSDSTTCWWATCAQQNVKSNGWHKRRSLPTKTDCPGWHSRTVLNKGGIQFSTTQWITNNIKKKYIRHLEERPSLRRMRSHLANTRSAKNKVLSMTVSLLFRPKSIYTYNILSCLIEPISIDRCRELEQWVDFCCRSSLQLQPLCLDVNSNENAANKWGEALRSLLWMFWRSWMSLVLHLSTEIPADLANPDSAQPATNMFGLLSSVCYHGKVFSVRHLRRLHPSVHPEFLLCLHPKQNQTNINWQNLPLPNTIALLVSAVGLILIFFIVFFSASFFVCFFSFIFEENLIRIPCELPSRTNISDKYRSET